jgi:hypothetical protein
VVAREGGASVEIWRMASGEKRVLPASQVTVLEGAVGDGDGTLHGPGSRLDGEASRAVTAERASSLLLTLWS